MRWRLLPVVVLALLATLLSAGRPAEAHGKEVNIAVTCIVPDPGRPLTKACTAFLKYEDGDPVTKADLELTAAREGDVQLTLPPVNFKPLDQVGLYSAIVSFPAYGRWRMKFTVQEPDSGEAELVEELLPPAPNVSPDIRARLQVVFSFGLADIRNIAIRIVHLLAAVSWLALSGLTLALATLPDPQQRQRQLQRLAATFPWRVGVIILVLGISGALSARFNAPTRPPGLYAPGVVNGLPFGDAYLITFLVKLIIGVGMAGVTGGLALSLRRAYPTRVPILAGAADADDFSPDRYSRWVATLAAINLVLGLMVLGDVVIMGYFHVISHVGAAASAG